MPESRVQKSLLNAQVNLVFYVLTLALSFFSRKIFLQCLGNDFVGFTGTLYNLLGFLNLAELGIGMAIGYVLYKPLYDRDESKINEIISVFGYLYRKIGLIILAAGVVLSCFLPLIFPKTGFDFGIIYFAYFSFLASSLIGYFCNYKQTLLGADQRNYVVTAYFQTSQLIKTAIQIASAWYTGSYYLWVLIELGFGVVYSFILNWKVSRVYPWLRGSVKQGRLLFKEYPDVIRYTKQLFIHRIAVFVQYQTTPFLIYAFVSLPMVAFYGNYTLISEKISLFLNNLLGSTGAGVGHLIAEGSREKIRTVFWELFSLRMLMAGAICFSLYHLMPPFIGLWLGEEYILPNEILILVIVNMFIGITRGATDQFLFGYGLFWDVWAPVVESVVSIAVAIAGGFFWGLPGVLSGSIVSLILIVCIWKPFLLYHWGFREKVRSYWLRAGWQMVILVISFFAVQWLIGAVRWNPAESYGRWLSFACLITGAYVSCSFLLMFLSVPCMRTLSSRFWNILVRKIRQ